MAMRNHTTTAKVLDTLKAACVGDLEWLIAGQPVVALFSESGRPEYMAYDRQHLGQPSSHTGADKNFCLWIGMKTQTKELLVTLTLRVKAYSRKDAKKYRLFFLGLPVPSLVLDVPGSGLLIQRLHFKATSTLETAYPLLNEMIAMPLSSNSAKASAKQALVSNSVAR